ncbi:MAG: N-6 DNA methylase [Bacilli bacterium]|nr:N-6 DNA methylase [Bacilli bacterium]
MSEELTKGLVKKRLLEVGYPTNQDEIEDGLIYYKEDSYKSGINADRELTEAFINASKKLTGNAGSPDYTAKDITKDLIVVIECKPDVNKHQTYDNLDDYKTGLGSSKEISDYAINGAIHYATFLNYAYDVVAIAVSGISEDNYRCTTFFLPKGKGLESLYLLENGEFNDTIMKPTDYRLLIDEHLGKFKEEREQIENDLKVYAKQCNNFLRANHISAKDRAGFLSAIVLALTNKDSDFYKAVERAMPNPRIKKPYTEELGKKSINRLWEALREIWKEKDCLPEIKIKSLEEYYNSLLLTNLLETPEGESKYFNFGDNILSRSAYSIYQNIVLKIENHPRVDIMGTFYTAFLKYAKGDAKDKGVVLTPKHITELFCDIAECFLDKKLNEQTKVIDICTGTGGFLISALNKMDHNIDSLAISEEEKNIKKKIVRKECLIGVEREPEMFALAYANMRFHGDGKSNLYACSSLLKDKAIISENPKKTLQDEILNMDNRPSIGMINPPYSLLNSKTKKTKGKNKQTGQSELDFVYSMLEYLKPGGIGIAIIPMSCASSKDDKKMREAIMSKHTLLATMTMPKKLFQESKVGTSTCIMVFRAHIKHTDSSKIVFLSRWQDDGLVTIPHVGRYDKDNAWMSTKDEWLRQLKGIAKIDNTVYLRKELNKNDEWLAEAYVETDYNLLNEAEFENQLKKYALFKYMQENDLGDED